MIHNRLSLQAGSSLSCLACCDNAHRGRADVLCQRHICIHPQSPPLDWPDNGAALLPLHLNQKKEDEEEEGERRVTFWKPVPTLSKTAKWKD